MPIGELLRRALERLPSLVGASLLYGFSVLLGLVLLIVPGLLVAARWSLMAPGIMLERLWTFPARDRSRAIVRGEIENGLGDRTRTRNTANWAQILAGNAIACLTAPFQAHLLSVLYYRLTEPERPAIDPSVWSWRSVWEGPSG